MSLTIEGQAITAASEKAAPAKPSMQLEERMRDFLRAAAPWVWETDSELRLIAMGREATATLGIPSQLLLGQLLPSLAAEEPETVVLLKLMKVRQPFRNQPFRLRRPSDGSEIELLLSGVPFYEPGSGRFAGYRGTGGSASEEGLGRGGESGSATLLAREVERLSAEINDLRFAQQTLAQGDDQDQVSQQELARLGHELRSPLNAILGYADLVQQTPYGPLPIHYKDWLGRITMAAQHLQQLIEALGRNQQKLEETPSESEEHCLLGEALEEARSIAAIEADRRKLRWEIKVQEALRLAVPKAVMVQILLNLLGNAVKFSPEGGTVGVEAELQQQSEIQVVVWDQGRGIPKKLLTQIFEAGFQAPENKSNRGQGLGLAIARDLARRFGGDLTAERPPRGYKGARLVLALPLERLPKSPAKT